MYILLQKFKEVIISVLPISIIVLILNYTLFQFEPAQPLETAQIIRFIIGSLIIIIGMSIFLFGVDIAITPLGKMLGTTLTKSNSVFIVGIVGLVLGFLISIAEPALHILAGQVNTVTNGEISYWSLIIAVSIGLAIMVSLGLLRTIFNIALNKLLLILYLIIFVFSLFTPKEFMVIAFDSSGATTGAMAVPFLLSLCLGISSLKKKGKSSEEDSFGLVAIASAGAILGVLIMGVFSNAQNFTGDLNSDTPQSTSIIGPFIELLPQQIRDVLIALSPLLLLFIIMQIVSFKLPKKQVKKILKGMVYTTIGLILFLLGVNAGFMEVGKEVGYIMTLIKHDWLIVLVGFILGLVIILAEPAVYVLIRQIEDVTSGSLKKMSVVIALGIGVASAVCLSMIRVLTPSLELWHYLLPGYIIAFTLSFIVPEIFVGMAFDSGGVASGPMIGTFIFAYVQGVANGKNANLLTDGFGMISMVALTPLIALQILGLIYKIKLRKGGLKS